MLASPSLRRELYIAYFEVRIRSKTYTFLSMTSHFFLALREACSTELFLLGDFTGSPDDLPATPENLELDVEALADTDELE